MFGERRVSHGNARQPRSINENPLSSVQLRLTQQSQVGHPSTHSLKSGHKNAQSKPNLTLPGGQSAAQKSQRAFLNAASRPSAGSSQARNGLGVCSGRQRSQATFESRVAHQTAPTIAQEQEDLALSSRGGADGSLSYCLADGRAPMAVGSQSVEQGEAQAAESGRRSSHLPSRSTVISNPHHYRTKLQSKYG